MLCPLLTLAAFSTVLVPVYGSEELYLEVSTSDVRLPDIFVLADSILLPKSPGEAVVLAPSSSLLFT